MAAALSSRTLFFNIHQSYPALVTTERRYAEQTSAPYAALNHVYIKSAMNTSTDERQLTLPRRRFPSAGSASLAFAAAVLGVVLYWPGYAVTLPGAS